jgi:putative nucleotidyltransferase with HDIG domain
MTAHEMVAKARNLPQISEAAMLLAQVVGRPETNNEEVVELLKCDSVLTAKLLRATNSPMLGLREPVTSVDQAVLLLGHNQIYNLVLSLALSSTMSAPLPGYALKAEDLWRHALTAAAAAEVALRNGLCSEADAAVAFTIGLLHDIGKVVMAQALPQDALSVIRNHMASEGLGSVQAEREAVGTDHAEVGSCLLYLWRLPEQVVEAVANHHQPMLAPTPRLSALAHVANRFAHLAVAEPESEAYAFSSHERVAEVFHLDEARQGELLAAVHEAEGRTRGLMAMAGSSVVNS